MIRISPHKPMNPTVQAFLDFERLWADSLARASRKKSPTPLFDKYYGNGSN